jgi:hypothetical protein
MFYLETFFIAIGALATTAMAIVASVYAIDYLSHPWRILDKLGRDLIRVGSELESLRQEITSLQIQVYNTNQKIDKIGNKKTRRR